MFSIRVPKAMSYHKVMFLFEKRYSLLQFKHKCATLIQSGHLRLKPKAKRGITCPCGCSIPNLTSSFMCPLIFIFFGALRSAPLPVITLSFAVHSLRMGGTTDQNQGGACLRPAVASSSLLFLSGPEGSAALDETSSAMSRARGESL